MPRFSVLFCLLGDRSVASSRVRGYWMAEEFEKQSIVCTIIAGDGRRALLSISRRIPGHDVIFFQKHVSRWHIRLMGVAKLLGKTTVFDLDDAPCRTNSPMTLKNAGEMMSMASVVMAGSRALMEYPKQYNENTFFLPTCVKLENYAPAERKDSEKQVCLGWIGNGPHYADDLIQVLCGPLRQIGATKQVRFKLLGACGDQRLYDAFSGIPGVTAELIDQIPWGDAEAVRNQLSDIDIGLYPLLPNTFNENKSGFKVLEYMAMGIPVIASPVAMLCDIVEDGKQGFLGGSEKKWVESIFRLLAQEELRRTMGKVGRAEVESYDIAKAADFLLGIIRRKGNEKLRRSA